MFNCPMSSGIGFNASLSTLDSESCEGTVHLVLIALQHMDFLHVRSCLSMRMCGAWSTLTICY